MQNTGMIEVWPTDTNIKGSYSFYLYAEVNGGSNLLTGPFTFSLICGPNTITTISQGVFAVDQDFELSFSSIPVFTFA